MGQFLLILSRGRNLRTEFKNSTFLEHFHFVSEVRPLRLSGWNNVELFIIQNIVSNMTDLIWQMYSAVLNSLFTSSNKFLANRIKCKKHSPYPFRHFEFRTLISHWYLETSETPRVTSLKQIQSISKIIRNIGSTILHFKATVIFYVIWAIESDFTVTNLACVFHYVWNIPIKYIFEVRKKNNSLNFVSGTQNKKQWTSLCNQQLPHFLNYHIPSRIQIRMDTYTLSW